jgi:CRISPR-associated endonuclease/helicase Cas3
VLIATASVEMGVTFRAANVMLMEPGFAPMNFLQRYGRAARRGEDGAVIVRIQPDYAHNPDWLRPVIDWVKSHQGQTVSIETLSEVLSQSVRQQFQSESTVYYGTLPQQAIYTSGLYWQALLRHKSNKAHRREHLLQHQPASSKHLYGLLKQYAALESDDDYRRPALAWRELLFAQALNLRDIGRKVKVIHGNGLEQWVPVVWLQRETDVMNRYTAQLDVNGQEYFQLWEELDDELLPPEEKNHAIRKLSVSFPHTGRQMELDAGNGLVRGWLKYLKNMRDPDTEMAWENYPDAMKAAEQLVILTGLVPGGDVDLSAFATSMIL